MTFLSNSYVINRDTVIIMNEYEMSYLPTDHNDLTTAEIFKTLIHGIYP